MPPADPNRAAYHKAEEEDTCSNRVLHGNNNKRYNHGECDRQADEELVFTQRHFV